MKKILQYNWRFYAGTLPGVAAAMLFACFVPQPWRALVMVGTLPAVWWLASSLLVSYWVYDRSPFYSMRWLNSCLMRPPKNWVSIHAGLDETSPQLAAMFPGGKGQVLDIYDSREMTEPSIAEARRISTSATPAAASDWRALPLPDDAIDTAFLIFAAHELRRPEARAQLFVEVARVLREGGELVLVEHLRNWVNFLAFGPGFLHFLSERSWTRAADAAHLRVRLRTSLTPFVRVLVLRSSL